MKPYRFLLAVLFMSASSLTLAQSHDASHEVSPSKAQESFDILKTLAGSWVGQLTTFPSAPDFDGSFAQFSMRVTSRGHALAHELSLSGIPDHPLSMFYIEDDRLVLTHYCDAGNRPRMVGKVSPDGKSVEFDLVDLAGSNDHGHMHRAVFTFIDENHHTEDWTYMMPGDNPVRAHFELHRTNFASGPDGY
jgi:hypothetical protein